jgi:hypothetical protein
VLDPAVGGPVRLLQIAGGTKLCVAHVALPTRRSGSRSHQPELERERVRLEWISVSMVDAGMLHRSQVEHEHSPGMDDTHHR